MAAQLAQLPLRLPVARKGSPAPLLFYSQVAWDTVWQRPQEQAIGLSRHRPVVFISPVQLHELTSRLWDRWQFHRVLEKGRLHVISPLIFAGEYRNSAVRLVNRQLILKAVKPFTSHKGFLFLTNSPFSAWMLDSLKPRGVAYDLIDDFCAFSWAPPEGRNLENKLIRKSSIGFAGTGYLQEKYQGRLPHLEFLPSGVQYKRMTGPVPEPLELRSLPSPRILYVGTLNDRLDGRLFLEAAKANPTGSVIVIGPRHGTFACPELPDNVHFLGLQPHERLPEFYQHCDLGIMPFADNEAARAINPVKTLEYLACGLPVLSTPVPDVIKYYPEVVRVEPAPHWGKALTELLAEGKEEGAAMRSAFARNRSWKRLVDQMEQKLHSLEEPS